MRFLALYYRLLFVSGGGHSSVWSAGVVKEQLECDHEDDILDHSLGSSSPLETRAKRPEPPLD
jgi:hypothetical protein